MDYVPSFAQKAYADINSFSRRTVPVSQQIDAVETLHRMAKSMVSSDAELLSLTHRLAVYSDMDLNYRGDVMEWSVPFSESSNAYAYEYMDIMSSVRGDKP